MDILLTHGYCLDEDPAEREIMRPYPPLGILYISAYLKSKGFGVEVFDTTFQTLSDFEAYAREHRPPIVGLYANLMTRQNILRMIEFLKREIGSLVVLGGPEPTNYVEEFLARGADVIVSGEGEPTLEELVPHLTKHGPVNMAHIDGIAYSEDGQIVRTKPREKIADLDSLPFPDRAAIDLRRYIDAWREHHGHGSVSLITCRGCPYRCNWCSHSVFGYSHRRRSVENVVAEVEHILEVYDPELLWYADDVFTINKKWFFRYAEALKARGIRRPFETISREDRLDAEVVKTLAEMGCYRLWVGAESGSQRILDSMERKTDAARLREMIRLLKSHGIETGTFIMLGYVGEGIEDIEATVDHLKGCLPDHVLTTIAYPIKGTIFYEKVSDRVKPLKVWGQGSDRDYTILDRHSRRFYEHARNWMVSEVELHRLKQTEGGSYKEIAKLTARAKKSRLGMLATQRERERGEVAS